MPLPSLHTAVNDIGLPCSGSAIHISSQFQTEQVSFESAGVSIAGLLYIPRGAAASPGIVVLGPFGYVKEQAPVFYSTLLASEGFAVLIFDPRYSGESGGHPRRLESPEAKIADARAAIDYLAGNPNVDPRRIVVLGICQGASEMIAVAAADDRVQGAALVSGQYLYRRNLLDLFCGGGPSLDERIERGRQALARFEIDGTLDYTSVVSANDKSVALPWPPIHAWYYPWTTDRWGEPSRWENRYATMSDAEVWSFDVEAHARTMNKPTLLVHGENSDGGLPAVRHIYDTLPSSDKRLVVLEGIFHTRFYDDPSVVVPTAHLIAGWFAKQFR